MSDEITTEGYALSTFHQRVITGLLLIIGSFLVLAMGSWALVLAILAIAYQMDKEWHHITPPALSWKFAGIPYVALPLISALALRDLSFNAILFPVILIVATDVGAFFAGKTIGGPRIAPSISPNKTWSGLLGGMSAAALSAIALQSYVPFPDGLLSAILTGVIIALLAQAGDFFESWLKRKQGLKDSGSLLPGHGGILDRVDGYILTLPAFLLYLIISAEVIA
ncbi:MAG: phosphatidate cytidylyltransferase [Rickettsiales bacterium]|nr:phosphatidate cytidylyltransferase [Rickettsiales bacterium]